MRLVLIALLLVVGSTPFWSSPLLRGIYGAAYKVEFGPKYVQVTQSLNK